MLNKNKDFNTVKARQLLETYEENQNPDKINFLQNLIKYQEFFSPKSIVENDLLISGHYNQNIVEAVLHDLGLTLVTFKNEPKKLCIISFTVTEGI